MPKSPADIQAWLDANSYRLDLPAQYLGNEPNTAQRPWDTATARWCLLASWPYEAAAGNQSIPAVYKAIHDHDEAFLADRFYLPATPADLKLLEKNGLGAFGIESKHPLLDFDVVGSSISYPVLSMSFIKLLTMSGITPRWRDRDANTSPMVMAGGLSYGAPEVLAPVVDCWFLGEVEDEPGNPGIGAITHRIAAYKRLGRWTADRVGCYADLAREFNFLYFPRFVEVRYHYQDRSHAGVGPHPSKQVASYSSTLDGMRLPLRKRHVKDLNAIKPLDNPPLLYADSSMGAGDLEAGRGCEAWCSFCMASMRTKPARQRSVPYVVDYAKKLQANTGAARITPYSLDLPMHTQKRDLIASLLENVSDEVDASSMRVDDFNADHTFVLLQVSGGMDSVTLGVEGNCLHGSTRVQIPDVGVLRIDEVEQERNAKKINAGREVFDLGGAWQTGCQPLSRVTFSDGSQMLATREHMFWVLERGPAPGRVYLTPDQRAELGITSNYLSKRMQLDGVSERWKPLGELRKGDVLRSYYGQMRFPEFSPDGMNPDLAWLLGILSGDGRVDRKGIEIRVEDDGVEQQALVVLRRLGVEGRVKESAAGQRRLVTAYSRDFVRYLSTWGVFDTESKRRVPPAIWRSSRDVVAAYLNGVLDADGCVPLPRCGQDRGLSIMHGTHSEAFARELGQLITAFGHPVSVYAATTCGSRTWNTTIHSAPDVDWSWLTFSETTRKRKFEEARGRTGGRLGTVTWRGGDSGFKYVKVAQTEHDVERSPVFDLYVPGSHRFTANNVVVHNSQRMRDLIGKGTSDADIKEALTRGIRAGIRKFKLFMISNLPGEDEGDIFRVLRLAKDLADIRDSMNQPTVSIQFSWTPLIIEGNTPMQWFAPQPANRILGDVWEEFRDLKIAFKLGSKANPEKAAFFQLCQRASRDAGEALVDAMVDADQACWGGVPRTFKDTLEARLIARGFRNGFADCFDERQKRDMFGWEFIDQGISNELMWRAYVQMREFAELTDSSTYDLNFDENYHGGEWLVKCGSRCYGKSCGVCDYTDLKHRSTYLRAVDRDIDLTTLRPVDQHSQAARIRVKIYKHPQLRFVGNDHWRYLLRRALFRAQDNLDPAWDVGVAKRSIRFASDEVKHRDWTYGTDYAEFAFTRPVTDEQITAFLTEAGTHCTGRLTLHDWQRHPVNAVTIRHDVGSMFYDVELDENIDTVTAAITSFRDTDTIPMRLKVEGGYFAPSAETVNAKDYVHDLWLAPHGHQLSLRMLTKGRPNPYNVTAALMGKQSWLPYAKNQSRRLEIFTNTDRTQQDFLRPTCTGCGYGIPITMLGEPYDQLLCPRCADETGT